MLLAHNSPVGLSYEVTEGIFKAEASSIVSVGRENTPVLYSLYCPPILECFPIFRLVNVNGNDRSKNFFTHGAERIACDHYSRFYKNLLIYLPLRQ